MSLADRQRRLKSVSLFPNDSVSDSKFSCPQHPPPSVLEKLKHHPWSAHNQECSFVFFSSGFPFSSSPSWICYPSHLQLLGSYSGCKRHPTSLLLTCNHKSALCGTGLKSRLARKLWFGSEVWIYLEKPKMSHVPAPGPTWNLSSLSSDVRWQNSSFQCREPGDTTCRQAGCEPHESKDSSWSSMYVEPLKLVQCTTWTAVHDNTGNGKGHSLQEHCREGRSNVRKL